MKSDCEVNQELKETVGKLDIIRDSKSENPFGMWGLTIPSSVISSNTQFSLSLTSRHSVPTKVKQEVWHRDKGKCVQCGSKEKLEYDHIIPISKGGSNTARNIQLLCEHCNRKKSNRIE